MKYINLNIYSNFNSAICLPNNFGVSILKYLRFQGPGITNIAFTIENLDQCMELDIFLGYNETD
jgi:hypothetical protein